MTIKLLATKIQLVKDFKFKWKLILQSGSKLANKQILENRSRLRLS